MLVLLLNPNFRHTSLFKLFELEYLNPKTVYITIPHVYMVIHTKENNFGLGKISGPTGILQISKDLKIISETTIGRQFEIWINFMKFSQAV